jgi:hypothetical protein
MEPYFDLGSYTRGTSTTSASAQTWFDRGLIWSYAFHHEEAVRCFERAVEHDPGFALAHWGIAYAIGPNYNKQWEAFDPVDLAASLEKACDEVAAARACADRAAPVERALVGAPGSRYQANDPSADLVAWNADYDGSHDRPVPRAAGDGGWRSGQHASPHATARVATGDRLEPLQNREWAELRGGERTRGP